MEIEMNNDAKYFLTSKEIWGSILTILFGVANFFGIDIGLDINETASIVIMIIGLFWGGTRTTTKTGITFKR